jgi:hypothetical protein
MIKQRRPAKPFGELQTRQRKSELKRAVAE